jgi:phospholipase C
MEAGTNEFDDYVFTSSSSPSATNSTADPQHLVTQIASASAGISWKSYQEGLDDSTGACPIAASGQYVPRHNPVVFFRDVSGDPPSKTNEYCASHHAPLSALASDLRNQAVATYNFVTPDLCHDMHGAPGCSNNLVRSGDDWLGANLPPLIDFVNAHAGVIFVVWDEGDQTTKMPFIAVGPGVKKHYVGSAQYTHGSLLKSVEKILGVPVIARVAGENDFADLFVDGSFP